MGEERIAPNTTRSNLESRTVIGDWITVSRIGYLGRLNAKTQSFLQNVYGNKWRFTHIVDDCPLTQEESWQQYEESYLNLFKTQPQIRLWLVQTASEVYDNALTNIESGLDYKVQETNATHIQDIAVRRALTRLVLEEQSINYDPDNLPKIAILKGDHPVEIRGKDSEGFILNPGKVEFYRPESIITPPRPGWWDAGSVEDFWQSNKVIQMRKQYLQELFAEKDISLPGNKFYVEPKELDEMLLLWCDFQSKEPTIMATGYVGDEEHFVRSFHPYDRADYLSSAEFYQTLRTCSATSDLIIRSGNQLPRHTIKKLRQFTKKLEYIS